MTRSSSRKEDEARNEERPDKVSRTHGGEVVEAIAPEELESMNEPECKHERLIRDVSEDDFNAFICANPKCGIVVLFNKT
jgi:hypothetical protein